MSKMNVILEYLKKYPSSKIMISTNKAEEEAQDIWVTVAGYPNGTREHVSSLHVSTRIIEELDRRNCISTDDYIVHGMIAPLFVDIFGEVDEDD